MHRDPGADERVRPGEARPRALELDSVGAGLLDEADRVATASSSETWIRAERHVRDDQRPRGAPRVTARVSMSISSIVAGTVAVVAQHDHRGGVADEDEVDSGRVREPSARIVVRGHHDDPVAALLHLAELGERELPAAAWPAASLRGLLPETTLSIRRTRPTRTRRRESAGLRAAPPRRTRARAAAPRPAPRGPRRRRRPRGGGPRRDERAGEGRAACRSSAVR